VNADASWPDLDEAEARVLKIQTKLHQWAAVGRMGWDPATRAYVERRTTEGLSKKEILRCLKRYIARELFPLLARNPALLTHRQTCPAATPPLPTG